MNLSFKIGADPEVFVGDANSVRSIIGKIGGTKNAPMPLPMGDGFAVQEDNVALEYNIPASGSKAEFTTNIRLAMDFLETVVRDQYGYSFVNSSAISFPAAELEHPMAHVFGCEPDFNAWTNMVNPRPRANDKNLRSCGGHVHIGIDAKLKKAEKRSIIKACDLFLGVPSVLMDKGDLRKQLYGKAGAYRDKKYGVEYRTLSNFWVFDGALTDWVYDNTARAVNNIGMDFKEDAAAIQFAINNNCKETAQGLVSKYQIRMV